MIQLVSPPVVVLAFFMLFLLWRWYMQKREWMGEFSTALGVWREGLGIHQQEAADLLSKHLGYDIDLRTYQRWEQGKGQPSSATYVVMQQILNDGSASYGVMVDRDEVSEDELNALIEQSIARSRAKIAARANAKRRK